MKSRLFSASVSAVAISILGLMSRDARAEYLEKLSSFYPSSKADGCLVPVTRERIVGLPQAEQDRWIAWSWALYPTLEAKYELNARAARAYYATLEPAARKAFPASELSRVEVLSAAPLVVAKVVATGQSTWTLPEGVLSCARTEAGIPSRTSRANPTRCAKRPRASSR
jgi:hypothetical protein